MTALQKIDPLRRCPEFQVRRIEPNAYAIDDRGQTVAIVTQHGYVDWLRKTPHAPGEAVERLHKETHLSYILGFKFNLFVPYLMDETTRIGTKPVRIEATVEGATVHLRCEARRADGRFASLTEATLTVSEEHQRYEWALRTSITHLGTEPHTLHGLEFNNLCPGRAYRGIFHTGEEEFDRILVQTEKGTPLAFPFQHAFHYGRTLRAMAFGRRSWAGYFDSPGGSPVVTVTESDAPLHWEICDMYYDLHCQAKAPLTFEPGATVRFAYHLRYLDPAEARALANGEETLELPAATQAAHPFPAFHEGLNRFEEAIRLPGPDARCFYRPSEGRAWERLPEGCHALRLTSEGKPNVWSSEPPFHPINGTTLSVRAKVRVANVAGEGFKLRLCYYHYVWDAPAGFRPIETVESSVLLGSSDWQTLTLPPLAIPEGPVEDGMIRLELVLEGSGSAWVTDLDLSRL